MSTWDCFGRTLRIVVTFFCLCLTRPVELFRFLVEFHRLFHWGAWSPAIVLMSFPAWPAAVLLLVCWKKLRQAMSPAKEENCFFVQPDGLLARWLWAFSMEASVPLAIFLIHGNSKEAIVNAWHDYVLTKPFWRRHMERAGLSFPRQLGVWSGEAVEWWCRAKGKPASYQLGDVVLKLMDGCLGEGDTFLEAGQGGFDGSLGAVTRVLADKYGGTQGVLVLEWVRPARGHEVHSFDITTMVMPDDTIEIVSCLYWGNLRAGAASTHDAKAGFVVDVEQERVASAATWYSALFAKTMGQEGQAPRGSGIGHGEVGVGSHFPGVRELCAKAIRGHESALREQPWLRMVGWDAMFSTAGPVFFEGNYASHRMPRRVFLTWQNTAWFLLHGGRFSSALAEHATAQKAAPQRTRRSGRLAARVGSEIAESTVCPA